MIYVFFIIKEEAIIFGYAMSKLFNSNATNAKV